MSHSDDTEHRLKVETTEVGGVSVVRAVGTVDLYTSPSLRKVLLRILKSQSPNIVVDLAEVDYMDSSGLATLVEALQRLIAKGGSMRLASTRKEITFVIELARLDRIFKLDDSVDESLRQLGVPAQ